MTFTVFPTASIVELTGTGTHTQGPLRPLQ